MRRKTDRFNRVALGQWILTLLVVMIVAALTGIFVWHHPDKDLPSWASNLLTGIFVAVALEWRNIVHATASKDPDTDTPQENPK